ncbi:MAG: ABC transporter ATP-binding protein [Nanoarchaeota archaeon]|nr:ABC transporter ATP-binding protein [Nanoarchaeota archaeon]
MLLKLQDVSMAIGNALVVDGVAFSIGIGERIALIGPNGCGKTTILNLVSGLLTPTRGKIIFNKQTEIGYSFQAAYSSLIPWLNVLDNIVLPLEIKGATKKEAEEAGLRLLKGTSLYKYRSMPLYEISGGFQQYVSVYRALISKPDLILMDEPMAHLDLIEKKRLKAEIEAHIQKSRTSLLFTTHDLEDALSLSDRIIILSGKPARIIEILETGKIMKGTAKNYHNEKLKKLAEKHWWNNEE